MEELADSATKNFVVDFSWRPETMANFFASPGSSTSSAMVKVEFEVSLTIITANIGITSYITLRESNQEMTVLCAAGLILDPHWPSLIGPEHYPNVTLDSYFVF